MMLSSSRVLKSAIVKMAEEAVVVEIGSQPLSSAEDLEPDDPNKREHDARKAAEKIIGDAKRQADEIIQDAVRTAAKKQSEIQRKAESDATRLMGESREAGYNEGMAAAIAEGTRIKADAMQILAGAKAERESMQENLEPDAVKMIIAIAEKILGDTAKINPAVIVNLVRQGFAAATITGEVAVYVSADDYDAVNEHKNEILALTDGSVTLKIKKDLSLSPMDCVIETPFGNVDCSLGQQFEAIRANLTYILNSRG